MRVRMAPQIAAKRQTMLLSITVILSNHHTIVSFTPL